MQLPFYATNELARDLPMAMAAFTQTTHSGFWMTVRPRRGIEPTQAQCLVHQIHLPLLVNQEQMHFLLRMQLPFLCHPWTCK